MSHDRQSPASRHVGDTRGAVLPGAPQAGRPGYTHVFRLGGLRLTGPLSWPMNVRRGEAPQPCSQCPGRWLEEVIGPVDLGFQSWLTGVTCCACLGYTPDASIRPKGLFLTGAPQAKSFMLPFWAGCRDAWGPGRPCRRGRHMQT